MLNNMKLDLDSKKWKEFVIKDLFNTKIGKNIDGNKINKSSGKFAYLTRKESNNGLDGFINHEEDYLNNDKPVITIGNETAEPFVQDFPFFTGTKVNILIPKNDISKTALLFVSQSIKMHKTKYSYSYTINSTRLKKQKLFLPINTKGEPDFNFMEAFIKQKEQEKLQEYENYISERIKALKDFKIVEPNKEKKFSEFEIGKLFDLSQGKSKGLNHLKKVKRGINYLGATNLNNGVLCQVEKVEKLIHEGNCIAFIRNGEGSMGYSVYKSEEFIATSDISVGYNSNLNRPIGLFITTVADKVRGKYNFGYKRSAKRLKKEKILLPINDQNEPDYDYMENYMKQLEYKKLNEYLKTKNKMISKR